MDSAPFLQAEDKPDFERILEDLLHHDEVRLALRRAPGGPNAEQLHTRAMRDFAAIAANAGAEYSYYRELREQVRSTTPAPDWERLGGDDPAQWQAPDSAIDAAERAGWVPLIAVLLPILSGLGAIVMLLLGYTFRANHLALGQPLVTAGFVFAVVCAASIAVDIIGLLLTAARDAATPPDGRSPELYAELAKAKDTWRGSLREQALLPYLLTQLGAPQHLGAPFGVASRPLGVSLVRAKPKLGYTSPGFTSPGAERISNLVGQEIEPDPDAPPHFSSPGYTRPGPERLTNERGEEVEPDPAAPPHFSSPGFTSPDFTSPDFSSSTAVEEHPEIPAARRSTRTRSRFLPNADDEIGAGDEAE